MLLLLIIVLCIYSISNYYIGSTFLIWLSYLVVDIPIPIYWSIYLLLAATTLFAFASSFIKMNKKGKLIQCLGRLGEFWMGVYFYTLLFFGIKSLIVFVCRLLGITIPLFTANSIALLFAVLTIAYGYVHAKNLQRKEYQINITKTTTIDGLSIVVASDIHLGYTNNTRYLKKLITAITALQPDLVLLPGDIINGDYDAIANPEAMIALFKSIQTEYGVYACLGNHDAGPTYDKMATFLTDSNIHILNDEATVIADAFVLVGRIDPTPIGKQNPKRTKSMESILEGIDTSLPVLVMDHQPATNNTYDANTDLIISGHTHKGQVFPFGYVTRAIFTIDYGYYQKDAQSPQVIVTSGAATWGLPLRVGSDSEIVHIKPTFKST